jgi:hypothetical protein
MNRLLGRAALSIDCHAWHRLRPARSKNGISSNVPCLITDLGDATHDHVVDENRVKAAAFSKSLESLCRKVGRVPI